MFCSKLLHHSLFHWKTPMLRRHFISTLAAASVVPGISFAQGKPIRLVVPFPPGGATDITARVLGEPVAKILQQPVVIDNRAGAGGSIGMAELARATPDGLTFGIATLSTHGVNPAVYQKLPYDPIKGFTAVTEIVKAPGVIVINPAKLPVANFAELVKYLKANPARCRTPRRATAPSATCGASCSRAAPEPRWCTSPTAVRAPH
jgi:tripartite-type tricarboxylate transporter receptor subunit TctC